MKVQIEELSKLRFNGGEDLKEFLNFIYRVERDQKNTNKNTEHNLAIYHIDGKMQTVKFGDLDRRIEIKEISQELMEAYGLDSSDLLNVTTKFTILDDIGSNLGESVEYRDLVSVVNHVIKQRDDLDRCLFHVAHIDDFDGFQIYNIMVRWG